jgi:hypothetical protein
MPTAAALTLMRLKDLASNNLLQIAIRDSGPKGAERGGFAVRLAAPADGLT